MSEQPIQPNSPIKPEGFTVEPFPTGTRLQVVTLNRATVEAFSESTEQWDMQAIEYKPFLRFAVADTLDRICAHTLGRTLLSIIKNRTTGAFLLGGEGASAEESVDFFIKLSTAVSHLIGLPNFDAMYGKYYARFAVRNEDSSDSFLRQAHHRLELHNDGTFVKERTDFVLMMKLAEENMGGGESLVLHIDDWKDLNIFYHHPLAKQNIQWGSPPSKNVSYKLHHPVFFEEDSSGKPHILYIDQFAEPQNMAQGMYLYKLGASLENEENCLRVRVPVGTMLVLHNHRWFHGRDKFVPHPKLFRELLRQRGHFTR